MMLTMIKMMKMIVVLMRMTYATDEGSEIGDQTHVAYLLILRFSQVVSLKGIAMKTKYEIKIKCTI